MSEASNDNLAIFETDESLIEDFRFAFVVFSLVPFLGILFSIPAIVLSVFALCKSYGTFKRKLVVISALICAGQIVLWSLLFIAPQLAA